MGVELNYDRLPVLLRPQRPITELLMLALPTVAQMASYTIMQFVDTWMLSLLGDLPPTAAGNAGLFGFAVISFGMGVMWVVNTLVSQAFGREHFRDCGIYLWQGIWFSIAYSLLLLVTLPVAHLFFEIPGHEPNLVALEASYYRITVGAAVLKLAATALGQFLLAIHRPMPVLYAAVIAVSFNIFADWVLIFGRLGFAPMGLAGAAWATNLSVAVELAVLVFFVLRPAVRFRFNVLAWPLRWLEMKTLLRVGVPSGAQLVADVLAWAVFGIAVMALFGTPAMAAHNYMMRYMVVSFMPAFGISTAVTALVGRYIGMGRPDVARQRAHLGFAVTAIYMTTCGIFFFLGRNLLIGLFTADDEVLRLGAMLLVFAAVYQFFDAMYIIYNGALRGAGDTFVPAVATGVLCWGITVFGGYLIGYYWREFGPAGPWLAATGYGIILGLFIFARFRRGAWMKIHLDESIHSNSIASSAKVETS